jgi:hypothetical protein
MKNIATHFTRIMQSIVRKWKTVNKTRQSHHFAEVAFQANLSYSVSMINFAGHSQTVFRLAIVGSELAVPPLNAPPG